MRMWFGLAKTNRAGFFVCFFWGFLQWKFWSGENCVAALVSGEERFLDLGKTFLPYALSSGYLSISGLLWLRKVFSFWPFLDSGGSCCCSPVEQSPSSCSHREPVTPSVVPARIQCAGDHQEHCHAGGAGCDQLEWKMPFYSEKERQFFSGTLFAITSPFLLLAAEWVRIPDVFILLILLRL